MLDEDRAGPSLLLVGCGAMAGAMLTRWINVGADPDTIAVVRASGRPAAPGVAVSTEIAGPPPAMVLLGVKPFMLDTVTGDVARVIGSDTILISILAGVDLASLRRRFPAARAVVRAMPNLPVEHGEGVVALIGDEPAAVDAVAALMAPLGLVERIDDERLFDAVTALAGSGPAFLYRFVDALARAGEAVGLAPDQAARLAGATVAGSTGLMTRSDRAPAALADAVASKGGSTRAGLNVLDADDALVRLLAETLRAAEARNAEMAAEARR